MLSLHFRWAVNRYMPEVMDIENACFGERSWPEDEFRGRLRSRNTVGMAAEYCDQIVGFVVYELHKERLEVINLAVRPDYQRMGVATALLDKLKSKLHPERRKAIECCVWDGNLDAQLFMRANGLMCVDTWPHWYEGDGDAYRFLFRHEWAACDEQIGAAEAVQ